MNEQQTNIQLGRGSPHRGRGRGRGRGHGRGARSQRTQRSDNTISNGYSHADQSRGGGVAYPIRPRNGQHLPGGGENFGQTSPSDGRWEQPSPTGGSPATPGVSPGPRLGRYHAVPPPPNLTNSVPGSYNSAQGVSPAPAWTTSAVGPTFKCAPKTVPVPQTEEHLKLIEALVLPLDVLSSKGFVIGQPTDSELDKKIKCSLCCKALINGKRRQQQGQSRLEAQEERPKALFHELCPHPPPPAYQDDDDSEEIPAASVVRLVQEDQTEESKEAKVKAEAAKKKQHKCKYHDGFPRGSVWSCCGTHYIYGAPCKSAEDHTAREYAPGELQKHWLFSQTPTLSSNLNARAIIALDCEMGVSEAGDSELIRASVIDYFTGEILVDKLVYPDTPMKHLNTRFSGVSFQALNTARNTGNCFLGKDAARESVLRFVNAKTIVVVHGGNGDFISLRWIHNRIVDTFLIEEARRKALEPHEQQNHKMKNEGTNEKETVDSKDRARGGEPAYKNEVSVRTERDDQGGGKKKKPWNKRDPNGMSLKALAKARLNRAIQMGEHDSVEDAAATRDILHWLVMNPLPEPEPKQPEEE